MALVPLALDAYLPAFPDIATDLGVSTSEVGLTLSIYVMLLAAGQLVGGPLSDRFGRRSIMFSGLAIFITGSILVTTTSSLPLMLSARAVQAFGGGWVAVSVPAIVRDRSSGSDTARLFSLIALIMFMAPAIAPALGSALMGAAGWHGIFWFLAGYGVLVALLLHRFLFRGLPAAPRNRQPLHTLITNYRHVLGHGTTMLLVLLQALTFSVLVIYITHASFLLQDWLGLGNSGFSAVFALNVVAMAAVSMLNRLLLRHFQPRHILAVAVRFQLVAVLMLLAVTLLDLSRWLVIPALMLIVGSMGASSPNVQASVMQYFKKLAGTAAALLGAFQFAGAGVVSAASAVLVRGHAERVALSMLACALIASLIMLPIGRRLRQEPVED